MNKSPYNTKPIEVEFRNIETSQGYRNVNVTETVKTKKLPFKMVVLLLQKKAKKILNNKEMIVELVTKALLFCKKLGNISFLKKWFLDVPLLCDMLIDTINGVYKNAPYSSLVIVVIAIIYTVSPIDILNDAIPVLGILDDALILKAVLGTVRNDLESYSSWKEKQEAA